MADRGGTPDPDLDRRAAVERRIEAEPYGFGFFEALRRLEAGRSDGGRLGSSLRAGEDPVRIGQEPTLIFAPATLAAFKASALGSPARLATFFFGLFGPNGGLPLHLTEFARERLRNHGDPTFSRFVDLFHHRMFSLYYRAWAQAQAAVSLDRPETDEFGRLVASLIGLGEPELRERDGMPDLAKLHYSGRLACQTRNAEGLEAIVGDFFRIACRIEEFHPRWVSLPRRSLCFLGASPDTGLLGSTATIGERIEVWHHKFRIRLGPMSLADYMRLLPDGRSLARLAPVVRNYIGEELDWDVCLCLFKQEVPGVKLGKAGRLGWTSWLETGRRARDAEDLILSVDA